MALCGLPYTGFLMTHDALFDVQGQLEHLPCSNVARSLEHLAHSNISKVIRTFEFRAQDSRASFPFRDFSSPQGERKLDDVRLNGISHYFK
jgi:hypothetical protein